MRSLRSGNSSTTVGGLNPQSRRLNQENCIGVSAPGPSKPMKRSAPFPSECPPSKSPFGQHFHNTYTEDNSFMTDANAISQFPIIYDETTAANNQEILRKRMTSSKSSIFTAKNREEMMGYIRVLREALTDADNNLRTGQEWITDAANCKVDLFNTIQSLQNELNITQKELEHKDHDLNTAKDMALKLQRIATDARSNLSTVQNKLVEKDNTQNSVEFKLKELEASLSSAQSKITQLEMQLANTQEKLQREAETNTDLKRQLDAKGRELSDNLTQTNAALELLKQVQDKLSQAENEKTTLNMELNNTRRQLEDVERRLEKHERHIDEAKHKNENMLNERDELRTQAISYQTKLEMLQKEHDRNSAELDRVRQELHSISQQLVSEREKREFESTMRAKAERDIETFDERTRSLTEQLNSAQAELSRVRDEYMRERQTFASTREELKDAHAREKEELSVKMRELSDELRREKNEAEERYLSEKIKLETRVKLLEEEIKCARESREQMFRELSSKESECERANMELLALRKVHGKADNKVLEENCQLDIENQKLRKMLEMNDAQMKDYTGLEELVKELKEKLLQGELERRKMHNQIQELKGNIRVMCRIRPLLPSDGETEYNTVETFPDGTALAIACNDKVSTFQYDRVFDHTSTQADVFAEVSQLVQSSLDGYNVCLFSYGQTGSGKTWTMAGGNSAEDAGIIRRSVGKILQDIKEYNEQGWEYSLQASFCEIYNEKLIDLVGGDFSPLDIKQDPATKKTFVPGLTRHSIEKMRDLEVLADRANKNRSTAATDMNERSSRSHCIFTLYISGSNAKLNTTIEGSLHLCDLAGSERLQRTNAEGSRLAEAVAINGSLSHLTTMFRNLASGGVASFRDSKLTYLLKDCFTGSGKTLMFVNLSPTAASAHESQCSLRFASTVSQVHMGQAKKNVSKNDDGKDTGSAARAAAPGAAVPSYMKPKVAPGAAAARPASAAPMGAAARAGSATGAAAGARVTRPATARK